MEKCYILINHMAELTQLAIKLKNDPQHRFHKDVPIESLVAQTVLVRSMEI
jgi:hypothetical protein